MSGLADLQRLVKVCGLLGSSHDGEVVAAVRQAERIRKQAGVSWEDLLVPSARPMPGQTSRGRSDAGDFPHWRQAARFCMERCPKLSAWELQFVTTLAGYKAQPSGKQLDILQRLFERCGEPA